jgi:hypothetical protein
MTFILEQDLGEMAQEQQKKATGGGNKPQAGGNKPKPTGNGATSGQSAKDKSRAQSRSVSAKAPAGRSGTSGGGAAKGGNKPRPGSAPPPQPSRRRMSGTMMAWGAVGLVIVIVVVLVIVKVATGGNTSNAALGYTPVQTAPADVVHDVSNIPLSVWNKVGITSSTVPVSPPTIVTGQPDLTINGNAPTMLYYGAEFCPYCAAERWAMTTALARFGTWSNLKITASSHTDVDAQTHTFSYYGASFSSPYIHFVGIEAYSTVPTATYYKPLQTPSKEELAAIEKYSSSKYLGSAGATTSGQISFPFADINNLAIISGASYDPSVLAGQTWSQIAGDLDNPNNPATQAILTTANYISAAICASSGNKPSSVCSSSGVQQAAKALKIS